MGDKSYVTMEQHVCALCGRAFDTNSILLDRRLRERFDMHTVTGWGKCPECQAQLDQGFVAFVGCKNPDSDSPKDTLTPEKADRTGEIAWVRKEAVARLFTVPIETQYVFATSDVMKYLRDLAEQAEAESKQGD